MKRIEKIVMEPKKEQAKAGKLRVCAYARVSTDTDDQKTSFDGQVEYYTNKITASPEYEFAGVYADLGITGTSAEKRPEFQRMIADCDAGKIDLILVKSLSRFARNTLQCLTYVRHLTSIGVNIVFESNNIDTRAAYSEMLLTVLSAFAQNESLSISENTIWGIRKRFEEGETRWCRLYGYEKGKGGEYQIVQGQAEVVRKIFWLYEHGETVSAIQDYLEANGIPSPQGEKRWKPMAVQTMLVNERYAGDILLQKFVTENHLTHKAIRNDSTEVPSFYIEQHHKEIVSRKQFKRCQEIREMRKMNGEPGRCIQYPIGEKLRCPYCGSVLYQRTVRVQSSRDAGWCCEKGDAACHGFIIRSKFVEAALLDAYGSLDAMEVEEKLEKKLEKKLEEKLENPEFAEPAKAMLEVMEEYPKFEKVDYWWVDELVDHITFGQHSLTEREILRMEARGERVLDDRTMEVHWRCGLTTTVKSGVATDRDDPKLVAKMYAAYLERKEQREQKNGREEETA